MENKKEYIGDGVYVLFDGYGLRLTTENGVETTNTIYLEPSVYRSLAEFVFRLSAKSEIREPTSDALARLRAIQEPTP